jgi:CheY-like chemotaxis protein
MKGTMSKKPGLRVFVVDDEHVIAETLATILKQRGYAASSFTNPLDALYAAQTDAPDLLISDVMMPQLSGVDLAIRVKASVPTCNVLLFSGQAQTADLLESPRQQGHDFKLLTKPIHPSDLLHEIAKDQ